MRFQSIVAQLLIDTRASRVTLRQEDPNEIFPITCEALAPRISTLIGVEAPNMAAQPVVRHVLEGQQVVQNDCQREFPDDDAFHKMLDLYGGLRAQIVTPVVIAGETRAIVSVHQLGRPRVWAEDVIAHCREAAERIRSQLAQAGHAQ